jgi:hypothetical protein
MSVIVIVLQLRFVLGRCQTLAVGSAHHLLVAVELGLSATPAVLPNRRQHVATIDELRREISVTLNTYTHILPEAWARVARKIEEARL